MRKIMIFILAAVLILVCAAVSYAVMVCEAEAEYLARAIAESYGGETFGVKVAISAVAVNIKEAGLTDSLAGAVAILLADGEFNELGRWCDKLDGETYRICIDAVNAAVAGADPTGGAMNFSRLEGKTKADLRFDDSREDEIERKMWRELDRLSSEAGSEVTPTIIDGFGFY